MYAEICLIRYQPKNLGKIHFESDLLIATFCFYQEEEACEVGEFRNNMTVTAGRLLRLSCPLASSPACLLATTRVQWQWAPAQDQPRTAVSSQFDNPPYFYLLVLDFTLFPSLTFFRECCQVSLVGTGACWEKEKQVLQ